MSCLNFEESNVVYEIVILRNDPKAPLYTHQVIYDYADHIPGSYEELEYVQSESAHKSPDNRPTLWAIVVSICSRIAEWKLTRLVSL